ncbi:Vacuolar protein sorting-associated protein 55-like protein [Diplonema papillatum]|nr:Vacuolar protein sorting-associated protein 55-like protein [Diplonema papillatum]
MDSDSSRGSMTRLITLAFFCFTAITLSILACTVAPDANAYPLLVLFSQLLAPVPLALCGLSNSDSFESMDGELPFMQIFAWFLTGALMSMALCVPFAMLHEDAVNGSQLAYMLASQAIMYGTMVVAARYHKATENSY